MNESVFETTDLKETSELKETNEVRETKRVIFEEVKCKQTNKTKKINTEKVKKLRVETNTWELNEEDLSHEKQVYIIGNLDSADNIHTSKFRAHIKAKINGYKQQDIMKNKYDKDRFVSYNEVIRLLNESSLKCCYCSSEIYILYEYVRESKQWTLDRINNDAGHNDGNLVIACLSCNLKRRRTNKDAFMFTKNMKITKMH